MTTDTIIIGAGLTGLTTAFKLKQANKKFIVLEKNNRPGGVIHTTQEDGFICESGPNSGVLSNPETVQLFDELRGKCQLEIAKEAVKKRYVLKNGQWHALPMGAWGAISTPLFSLYDKFRILGEPFRKAGTNPHETLAEMVKRRMGNSFLDYAIDPFILGVYAGDPNKLVPKYALPKLYNLEQKYGSFVKGTIQKTKEPKNELEKRVTREVFSVRGGLQKMIDSLVKEIGQENIYLEAKGIQIWPTDNGFAANYECDGELHTIEAKNIITTSGAFSLPELLPFVDENLITKISALHHTRVVELQLGFKNWQGIPLDGFGGLIPFKEKRDILGVMFMSALMENRAPENGALFAVFTGGVRRQDIYKKSNDEIKAIALAEFSKLMKTEQRPDIVKLQRYEHAIPQYYADSGERIFACEAIEKQFPGLFIGGNLRDGIGMADRIAQATKLAEKIVKHEKN